MTNGNSSFDVGSAAFVIGDSGRRCWEIESAPRVRGASVLKPLLFWVGADEEPFASDHTTWKVLAEPAITHSANDATADLWVQVGEARLLQALADRTGVAWTTDSGGEHPALRVMVTAGELAIAYASFASDSSGAAVALHRWMRHVPAEQTFGVRPLAADALGVSEEAVGVKCGWFGVERAHAVALVELPDRIVGTAVTTVRQPDTASRTAAVEASGDASRLIAAHDSFLGQCLRSATHRALDAVARI